MARDWAPPPPYYLPPRDAAEPPSVISTPVAVSAQAVPRYLYYQIFSPDGAVESRCSFSDDLYTGRVIATRITPPRDVKSIKRFLCRQENISSIECVDLWESVLTSESKLSDQDRPQVLAPSGPGSNVDDPMALIVKDMLPGSSSQDRLQAPTPSSPVSYAGDPMTSIDKGMFPGSSNQDCLQVPAPSNPGPYSDDTMAPIIKDMPPTESNPIQRPHSIPSPNSLGPFSPNASRFVSTTLTWHIKSVVFSPDGGQFASASFKYLTIWRVSSSEPAIGPIYINATIQSVAFSPDGRQVATGCDKFPYIRIWDICTGTFASLPFEGHTEDVTSIAFSPDGQQIASGSSDETIRLWDASLGQALSNPTIKFIGTINSLAFSPDGTRLLACSNWTIVCIWNVKSGEILAGPIELQYTHMVSVGFSLKGWWAVSALDDHDIGIWDVEDGLGIGSMPATAMRRLKGHTKHVTSSVSTDRQWIISGSWDATVRVWNFETGKTVISLPLPEDASVNDRRVCSVALSPKGDHIVAGTCEGSVYMWSRTYSLDSSSFFPPVK